jgi:small subunit ribosomal protein S16
MATKIKLQRLGKMREPHYRIVVADSRTKRDGRVIESIGQYHPKSDPSVIVVDGDRAKYWLGVGAQPTEAVMAILKVTGDWQSFKGEPAPPPMLVAAPKPDKKAIYDEASKAAAGIEDKPATTAKKKAAPKKAAEDKAAEDKATEEKAPEEKAAEPEAPAAEAEAPAPAAEETPAEPAAEA